MGLPGLRWKRAAIATTAALLAAVGTGSLAHAASDVEDMYAGETLTILIGHPPGGSYDLYAQLAAEHFGDFIPGNPNVIVQYMPGGGGLRAASHFARNVEPDGKTVAILPDTLAHVQLLEPERADWDASEFRYVGRFAPANSGFAIGPNAPVSSPGEMTETEVIVGCTGKNARSAQVPALMKNLLGYKLRLICGYKGSSAAKLATLRGEVDMFSQNWASFAAKDRAALESGDLRIIMQAGLERDPELQDVPLLFELTDDPEAQAVLEFASAGAPIGRSMMLPPGSSDAVVAVLREAFQQMVSDEDFLADAQKRGAIIVPATGERVEEVVRGIVDVDRDLLEAARTAMDASSAEAAAN